MSLEELLEIDLPIIQAPMACVQDHALMVVASNPATQKFALQRQHSKRLVDLQHRE